MKAAYYIVGIVLILLGIWIVGGQFLPDRHEAEVSERYCHDQDQLEQALSDPEHLAQWLLPNGPEATIKSSQGIHSIRWVENDERALEVTVREEESAGDYRYEYGVAPYFQVEARSRIGPTEDGGEHIVTLQAFTELETISGRWFMITPEVRRWMELPHQTFEEAVELHHGLLQDHLESHFGQCPGQESSD
ncbi:hypothetical protein VCB98_07430 [Gammaproteobacteria bacterium AB-CW1]|uniref:SRPBCC family protein n=1 Tax=Natronospira elongata TaxID=3110268 RepID=A0AAP6JEQ6_9GAMM|nr:hypothetical protein [Gammaproteobacteria bacterium AB-CW1]